MVNHAKAMISEKHRINTLIIIVFTFFIIIPNRVEAFNGGFVEEGFKLKLCGAVGNYNILGNNLFSGGIFSFKILSQMADDVIASSAKIRRSFIVFCNFQNFDRTGSGKPMINQSTNQIAEHSATGECKNIGNCDHRILLWGGIVIGLISAIIFYDVILRFF